MSAENALLRIVKCPQPLVGGPIPDRRKKIISLKFCFEFLQIHVCLRFILKTISVLFTRLRLTHKTFIGYMNCI